MGVAVAASTFKKLAVAAIARDPPGPGDHTSVLAAAAVVACAATLVYA